MSDNVIEFLVPSREQPCTRRVQGRSVALTWGEPTGYVHRDGRSINVWRDKGGWRLDLFDGKVTYQPIVGDDGEVLRWGTRDEAVAEATRIAVGGSDMDAQELAILSDEDVTRALGELEVLRAELARCERRIALVEQRLHRCLVERHVTTEDGP